MDEPLDEPMDDGERTYTEALTEIRTILDERRDLYTATPPKPTRAMQTELERLRQEERKWVGVLESVEAEADENRLWTLHRLANWRLYDHPFA